MRPARNKTDAGPALVGIVVLVNVVLACCAGLTSLGSDSAEPDVTQTTTVTTTPTVTAATPTTMVTSMPAPVAPSSSPAPAPTSGTPPATSEGRAAPFANCTEARAAGGAPVWRGDDGYGPHLDRDGDGVGCET